MRFQDPTPGMAPKESSITSLVIVPHRDLAYQLLHWIHRMTASPKVLSVPPISSIAQVLVRDGATLLPTQISALHAQPPHILIGTPQILLDVYNEDRDALQLGTLSTVVVDEVDYLIESVPRKPSQKMMEKARKKLDRHPSATRQLLDVIYAARVQEHKNRSDDSERLQHLKNTIPQPHSPQLIMSSATLRNHLKIYLFNESGWLRTDKLQKITGPRLKDSRRLPFDGEWVQGVQPQTDIGGKDMHPSGSEVAEKSERDGLGGTDISHSVLVVSRTGEIKNIAGAVRVEEVSAPAPAATEDQAITPQGLFSSPEEPDIKPATHDRLAESEKPYIILRK